MCGISGGVDSSTALHYAVELGLKPLAFTMDNGWNNREPMKIFKLIEKLKVPLYRYVLDLESLENYRRPL